MSDCGGFWTVNTNGNYLCRCPIVAYQDDSTYLIHCWHSKDSGNKYLVALLLIFSNFSISALCQGDQRVLAYSKLWMYQGKLSSFFQVLIVQLDISFEKKQCTTSFGCNIVDVFGSDCIVMPRYLQFSTLSNGVPCK